MEVAEGSTGAAAIASEPLQEDDSAVASWFVVDEETASELSKLLDLFEVPTPPMKVRFIDDPYSSPVIFQSSSAYVTINGNEESCGSSFSDFDSSVMASVDLGKSRGGARRFDCSTEAAEGWIRGSSFGEADVELEDFLVDGCDYLDGGAEEDAMWVDFLGEIYL